MIDRQAMGLLPDKPHTTLRDKDGKLFYEEMHTRGGFGGPFTYFYHRYPITAHTETGPSDRGYGLRWRRPALRTRSVVAST